MLIKLEDGLLFLFFKINWENFVNRQNFGWGYAFDLLFFILTCINKL